MQFNDMNHLTHFVAKMGESVEQLGAATTNARNALARLFPILHVAGRRAQACRVLGYDDDQHAPAWVRGVHQQQIIQFGSGNGRSEDILP